MPVLTMIETAANQRWLFSSNKLKDIVGGSELLGRCTTSWLFDALRSLRLGTLSWSETVTERAEMLRDRSRNRRGGQVFVVLATSGKAIFVTETPNDARSIIQTVTRRALVEAPGLDLRGVWVDAPDLDSTEAGAAAMSALHRLISRERAATTPVIVRARQRPIVARCVATGAPASARVATPDGMEQTLSAAVVARRAATATARARFNMLAASTEVDENSFVDSIEQFEPGDRHALIHVDTNGLGQVLIDFGGFVRVGESFIDAYQAFVLGVEESAAKAFSDAMETIDKTVTSVSRLSVVPVVVGGDDTTLICRGTDAFDFVGAILGAFERHSLDHADVGGRLGRPLTACAGVVWTKAGYPLSLAMALADDLTGHAKRAVRSLGWPASAWEFHDVHDSVAVTRDSVLEELRVNGGDTLLCQRPVFVAGLAPQWSSGGLNDFVRRRTHEGLRRRVDVLRETIRGKGGLTTAQLYSLRTAVFFGHQVGDAQLALVEDRIGNGPAAARALGAIREDEDRPSLFADTDYANDAAPATTRLLDALIVARAMEGAR